MLCDFFALCWHKFHEPNLPFHHIPRLFYWAEIWWLRNVLIWRTRKKSGQKNKVQKTSSSVQQWSKHSRQAGKTGFRQNPKFKITDRERTRARTQGTWSRRGVEIHEAKVKPSRRKHRKRIQHQPEHKTRFKTRQEVDFKTQIFTDCGSHLSRVNSVSVKKPVGDDSSFAPAWSVDAGQMDPLSWYFKFWPYQLNETHQTRRRFSGLLSWPLFPVLTPTVSFCRCSPSASTYCALRDDLFTSGVSIGYCWVTVVFLPSSTSLTSSDHTCSPRGGRQCQSAVSEIPRPARPAPAVISKLT